MICLRDLDVLRAQRIIGFFILITHKSTRSEIRSYCCISYFEDCYAPNGAHSDKPVLCALSVDNRIITAFKEERSGRREEVENIEVKLLEAGMYVYASHSTFEFDLDELWAAFFKMLLERKLVPRIIITNDSPAFQWISAFVKPRKFIMILTVYLSFLCRNQNQQ